jgi:hypothetical protein
MKPRLTLWNKECPFNTEWCGTQSRGYALEHGFPMLGPSGYFMRPAATFVNYTL